VAGRIVVEGRRAIVSPALATRTERQAADRRRLLPVLTMPGSDLYTGTLDMMILKALSWGPRHGYAIGRWIRETTDDVLLIQEGALYPALHRLERKGLVSEEWRVSETGRQAKYYALTSAGRANLRAERKRWDEYSRAVNRVLAKS
jgi:transcriptional regulator